MTYEIKISVDETLMKKRYGIEYCELYDKINVFLMEELKSDMNNNGFIVSDKIKEVNKNG